ncbi:CU044_2847 family protein [Actinomadura vinacea]
MAVVAVDGGRILIEVDSVPGADDLAAIYDGAEGVRRGLAEKVVDIGRPLFAEGLALVRECAEQVVAQMAEMPDGIRPDEYEVQLAVKLDAKVGAKIVDVNGGAQLQVVLRWTERR